MPSSSCIDKGLGKDNQGMKAALKPVLKFDSRGVSDLERGAHCRSSHSRSVAIRRTSIPTSSNGGRNPSIERRRKSQDPPSKKRKRLRNASAKKKRQRRRCILASQRSTIECAAGDELHWILWVSFQGAILTGDKEESLHVETEIVVSEVNPVQYVSPEHDR